MFVVAMIARQHIPKIEIRLQVRILNQLPYLLLDKRQLRRIQFFDRIVFIDQLIQRRERAVRFGARHRRRQVIHNHRVRPALRLTPLARIVDDERIDQRHVFEQEVWKTVSRQAHGFPWQPFERTVFSDMHDRVSAPPTCLDRCR